MAPIPRTTCSIALPSDRASPHLRVHSRLVRAGQKAAARNLALNRVLRWAVPLSTIIHFFPHGQGQVHDTRFATDVVHGLVHDEICLYNRGLGDKVKDPC